jgi:hypothetical protein
MRYHAPRRRPFAHNGRLVLGNYEVNHPSFFQGLLDDVRIYRRVLSPEEIRSDASTLAKGSF